MSRRRQENMFSEHVCRICEDSWRSTQPFRGHSSFYIIMRFTIVGDYINTMKTTFDFNFDFISSC